MSRRNRVAAQTGAETSSGNDEPTNTAIATLDMTGGDESDKVAAQTGAETPKITTTTLNIKNKNERTMQILQNVKNIVKNRG